MALTAAEEALVRELIAQNPELLSLAGNEATIISKIGATKKNLSQLAGALSLNDTDLAFVRQGSSDKSVALSVLKAFAVAGVPAASETVQGIVELATSAEAHSFTANKFIDGAKLADAFKGSNVSLASNGYQKLPSGMIIQWGRALNATAGNMTVTFPVAFPNAKFFECAQPIVGAPVGWDISASAGGTSLSQAVFSRRSGNGTTTNTTSSFDIYWYAIGY